MSMKNKKVLIVGGSRGIGEGVVNKFSSLGANVYYFSRQKKKKVDGENNRNINHIKEFSKKYSKMGIKIF